MTTITVSAVEAQAFAQVPPGESFWLVREGYYCMVHRRPFLEYSDSPCQCVIPPAEFVQACAPCEGCEGRQIASAPTKCVTCRCTNGTWSDDQTWTCRRCGDEWLEATFDIGPCPDCRVDLVHTVAEPTGPHTPWSTRGTLTIGHAYAMGKPAPIVHIVQALMNRAPSWPNVQINGHDIATLVSETDATDLRAALAHYGDLASLVGQWALELRPVTP